MDGTLLDRRSIFLVGNGGWSWWASSGEETSRLFSSAEDAELDARGTIAWMRSETFKGVSGSTVNIDDKSGSRNLMEMTPPSAAGEDTSAQDDVIQRAFAPLVGEPAWNAKKGQGSMLTMEFGRPHLSIAEPRKRRLSRSNLVREMPVHRGVIPVGEWHFWLYHCCWRLLLNEQQKICCDDPDDLMHEAAMVIDGQKLVSVTVNRPRGASRFDFDLGTVLETWPSGDNDAEEQWLLYTPEGQVLSFLADGKHVWGPATGNEPASG